MMTRRGACSCPPRSSGSSSIAALGGRWLYERHHGAYLCAVARMAGDGAAPVQQCDPLLHAEQPNAFTGPGPCVAGGCVESASPITYLQPNTAFVALEYHRHPRLSGVLADVGQRFLGDTIERRFDLRRQAPITQVLLVADLPALAAQDLHFQANRGRQPKIVQDGWTQAGNESACLADRAL